MRIGLNNIFTTLWFALMLGIGGALTYISIAKGLYVGDRIFIAKFFMGLLTLITIGVAGFFLFKFRLLIITDKRLISIHPFILRYRSLEINNISKISWTIWPLQATVFKTIELIDKTNKIVSFSDFEFENFDQLISKIPNLQTDTKKSDIYYEQAKSNLSFMSIMLMLNILFIGIIGYLSIVGDGFQMILVAFTILSLLLIYASQKRRMRYKRIIKNGP
jgi:hypothetical protein